MDRKLHVHFMGIGGSGVAPIAVIAKKSGFEVTGCDYNGTSYYCDELQDSGITIETGHSSGHLEGVDILAVTPAVFDINPNHPEVLEGRKRNILMTWQEFMGRYLQKDKTVIAVAGTHGKSTTTILTGLALEAGGLDPIVEAGTIYKPWGGGFRISESKYFVCEADEFNYNFLNYTPSIIIINNIEMDHPECFKNFNEFKGAFIQFIKNLKYSGTLVVNEECNGIKEVLSEMKDWLKEKNVNVIGYYLNNKYDFPFNAEYKGAITNLKEDGVDFDVYGPNFNDTYELGLLGAHNVLNSLGVLSAAIELGVNPDSLKNVFRNYTGIGRRTELVDEVNGIKVFDDYGHHPTAIAVVLDTLRATYIDKKIIAVVEPHQISRLIMFQDEFIEALSRADKVIITKTYIGREINKIIEPFNMNSLICKVADGKASYIEDFDHVADAVFLNAKPGDIVVVFGAGNSYKLTKIIIERLLNKKI